METIWDAVTGITAYARGIQHQDARVEVERIARRHFASWRPNWSGAVGNCRPISVERKNAENNECLEQWSLLGDWRDRIHH